MRSRLAPHSLELSEIGFGAAQLGNLYREVTDEEALAALREAWAVGIRYFDSAPHYGLGLSERRLGRFLTEVPREDVVVSTKVGRLLVDSPDTAHERDSDLFVVPATQRREWDFSRAGIRRSLDESRERLGIDRVDIAYIHDPDDHGPQALTEAAAALVELREEGAISAWGVGMNSWQLPLEFVRSTDIDVVMIAGRYTLLDQSALPLLDAAVEAGVSVVAAGVYNSGILGRDTIDRRALFDYAPANDAVVERAEHLAAICQRRSIPLPAAAVQFPLSHPAVASVVVGMRSATQVAQTIDRYEIAIGGELWTALATSAVKP